MLLYKHIIKYPKLNIRLPLYTNVWYKFMPMTYPKMITTSVYKKSNDNESKAESGKN